MAAADKAQRVWGSMTASARGRIMFEIARLIRQNAEAIAELECRSAGRPIRDVRGEAGRVADMFDYYGGWCDKLHGEVIPVPSSHLNYTRHEPLGVVVQITPWNAPLFTGGWQIAPAIAAGNGVVIKPSELTPLATLVLGVLCERAGAPKGLVNVLAGGGTTTGQAAISHDKTALVVFVGSEGAGSAIAQSAARNIVPCILELGGKSGNIVFPDADLDRAILGAQSAIFGGGRPELRRGLAPSRPPLDPCRVRGEVRARDEPHPRRLASERDDPDRPHQQPPPMVEDRRDGASEPRRRGGARARRRQAGGTRGNRRLFLRPDDPRRGEADAGDRAEGSLRPGRGGDALRGRGRGDRARQRHGLRSGRRVWTRDVGRAHRVAHGVRAGTFWINGYKTINVMSPFGGFGRSGYGRSSGREGLLAYTATKSVWVETSANPAVAFGYSAD